MMRHSIDHGSLSPHYTGLLEESYVRAVTQQVTGNSDVHPENYQPLASGSECSTQICTSGVKEVIRPSNRRAGAYLSAKLINSSEWVKSCAMRLTTSPCVALSLKTQLSVKIDAGFSDIHASSRGCFRKEIMIEDPQKYPQTNTWSSWAPMLRVPDSPCCVLFQQAHSFEASRNFPGLACAGAPHRQYRLY